MSPGFSAPGQRLFRATPSCKRTVPFCRLPLFTLFYRLEVSRLRDLMRFPVRSACAPCARACFSRSHPAASVPARVFCAGSCLQSLLVRWPSHFPSRAAPINTQDVSGAPVRKDKLKRKDNFPRTAGCCRRSRACIATLQRRLV